jgi:osmotically-inducible protein OsmY
MTQKIHSALLVASLAGTVALQGCIGVAAVGVGTGVLVATDRRPSENYVADEAIEIRAINRINDKHRGKVHINATSFNGKLLLTGEVPDEQIKADVEKIVAEVPNVKQVVNELEVGGVSSLASRSNDTYLTGKVKARFVEARKFQINHIKVTTESGVTYLMGLVTRQEADDATELARTTAGVRKVVRVFDYLASEEAKSSTSSK